MVPYPVGECTWYAAKTWKERYKTDALYFPRPPGSPPRHAKRWGDLAVQYGAHTSLQPIVGAVGVWKNLGGYGHVAIVEQVNPNGTVNVSEYNIVPKKYGERQNVTPADIYLIPPLQETDEFLKAWQQMHDLGVYTAYTQKTDVFTADRLAVILSRLYNTLRNA